MQQSAYQRSEGATRAIAVRRVWARLAASLCIAAATQALPTFEASATVLMAPDFPISPLRPETAGVLSAVRYQWSYFVTADESQAGDSDAAWAVPRSDAEGLTLAGGALMSSTRHEGTNAEVDLFGTVTPDTLRARTTVMIQHSSSANAQNHASAWVIVSNMDLITVTSGGRFGASGRIHGTVTKQVSLEPVAHPSQARGYATADIYIWEYGVGGLNRNPPAENVAFDFLDHASGRWTPEGGEVEQLTFDPLDLPTGSKWWVAQILEVNAVAQTTNRLFSRTPNSVTATADFAHTMRFFFDPLTPNASYTTASGFDYRTPLQPPPPPSNTVPEPASLALIGLGLAGLAASRKRKQQ